MLLGVYRDGNFGRDTGTMGQPSLPGETGHFPKKNSYSKILEIKSNPAIFSAFPLYIEYIQIHFECRAKISTTGNKHHEVVYAVF